jgi:hypothetical protein
MSKELGLVGRPITSVGKKCNMKSAISCIIIMVLSDIEEEKEEKEGINDRNNKT